MKTFFHFSGGFAFLLILPFFLETGLYKTPESKPLPAGNSNGVILEYAGTADAVVLNVPVETVIKTKKKDRPSLPHTELRFNIYLRFELDTSFGVRYEFMMNNKGRMIVHTGIFYQYAFPTVSVLYDFLKHKGKVNKYADTHIGNTKGYIEQEDEEKLKPIGGGRIDSFDCVHLSYLGDEGKSTWDLWMSQQIPGYNPIGIKVLFSDNPDLIFSISNSIFHWGGLVKLYCAFDKPEAASYGSFEVKLVKVTKNVNFPASEFVPPSQ